MLSTVKEKVEPEKVNEKFDDISLFGCCTCIYIDHEVIAGKRDSVLSTIEPTYHKHLIWTLIKKYGEY